mgnify:CR=1 FL=1
MGKTHEFYLMFKHRDGFDVLESWSDLLKLTVIEFLAYDTPDFVPD